MQHETVHHNNMGIIILCDDTQPELGEASAYQCCTLKSLSLHFSVQH